MLRCGILTIYLLFGIVIRSTIVLSFPNNNQRESLLNPVPWFIVEKYEENQKINNQRNISGDNYRDQLSTMSSTTVIPISKNHHSFKVCETKDCRIAAKNFVTNMDATVDPCEDFYGYVCGGWPAAHPLPPTESSLDQFTLRSNILNHQIRGILEEEIDIADLGPVKNAKRAYSACMNLDAIEKKGIEPILSILDKNGGWPIMMDASKRSHIPKFTWQQIEENYSREYGTDSIYGITVDVDLKNASINTIYMDQASTILPRSMITDEDNSPGLIADYTKYIEDVALVFANARRSRVPRERITNDAKSIVYFEIEIAKISSPDEMRRDINRLYNLRSIRRLQSWYNRAQPKTSNSKINWLKTIQNHFNDLKRNIRITDKVVIMEMEYYFKLASLLDKTPTRTILNYVHWRTVNSLLSSTTKQMRDIIFEMEKSMFGVSEQKERWVTCVNDHNMKHAISYQYVKKFLTDVARKTASGIVTEMQKEFETEIFRSTWMDERTKIAAKDKLNSMKRFISHPDWYNNQTAMIHHYKGLVISQDHFENTLAFKKYEHRKQFRKYNNPVEQDAWSTAPITINAYYDPSMNSLTFPAGILQAPFFSENVPDALNYGSIGAVIGHEISHGFDDVGRQFDKAGNAEQWWSDTTIEAFTERAQCFIDQYNNYTIEEISTSSKIYRANGELNQGENIADATGLEASYEIFKRRSKQRDEEEPRLAGLESFTHDQLFFISYGNTWCETTTIEYLTFLTISDAHPTNRLRVIGTLGNSEGFSKAFNCPVDSKMNREQKCKLWK